MEYEICIIDIWRMDVLNSGSSSDAPGFWTSLTKNLLIILVSTMNEYKTVEITITVLEYIKALKL